MNTPATKWKAILGVTLSALLLAAPTLGSQPALAAQSRTSTSSAITQARACLRAMLLANARVSYHNATSLSAPARYTAGPALATQEIVDRFNRSHLVVAHEDSLRMDAKPLWSSPNSYLFHAQLVFNETLTKDHKTLYGIHWDDFFLATRNRQGRFAVTDVIAPTPIRYSSPTGRFDYAPAASYPTIGQAFRSGLDHYQAHVHYAPGTVRIDPFGYYYDAKRQALRVYLFVHNGSQQPFYDLVSRLTAKLGQQTVFSGTFALKDSAFGILYPGQTRFTVVWLPASTISNQKLLLSYSQHTHFTSQFAFRAL